MLNLHENPYSKTEILQTLRNVNQTVTDYFAALSPEVFFAHPPEVWSPGENLQHLIQSVSPVARAMQVPREALSKRFGTAERRSSSFTDLHDTYKTALANGGAASGPYLPVFETENTDKAAQEQIIQKWVEVSGALVAAGEGWDEDELDTYPLPHPLLGVLTMREMLFFTTFHNLHHINDARRLVEAAP